MFYQLLPTSVGNEWGQQMRIQILILGFKGLKHYLKSTNPSSVHLQSGLSFLYKTNKKKREQKHILFYNSNQGVFHGL